MKFKGIAGRIIISVVPIIAICMILFIVIIYNVNDAQINSKINEKMSESLEAASLRIQNELIKNADIAKISALYAETCSRETIEKGELKEFLLKAISSNRNTMGGGIWFEPYKLYPDQRYFGPYVYVEDGRTIFAPEYALEVDYHNTNWYLDGKHSSGEPVWSDVYYDPVAKVTMITATVPFYGQDHTMLGVTTADMALTDIQKIASSLTVGATGQAFILGAGGEYISFLDDSRGIDQKIQEDADQALAALGAEVLTHNDGISNLTLNGIPKRAYYKTIPDTQWVLVILIDDSEIGNSTRDLVLGMSAVPLLGLVLATFSIIFVASHLRKIVNKVNSFADLAASGDFTKRIEITEYDEFGIMEDRLNKMMDNMSAMSAHSAQMLEVAQAASRAKGDFLSRMSHEIRTPLNAIIGMTQIAGKTNDIGKIEDCLNKIGYASRHLLNLINDILDMSKIEANKLELAPERFDLQGEIADIYNVNAIKMEEKQQVFELMIDENTPRFIIADRLRYSQVLTNLLSNATKFTPVGGKISLSVCMMDKDNGHCMIETRVRDTGIGLPMENQEKLFQSFEQADGGISRKYGGTGLGLAISKKIVELMGGKIWYESEIGKGSVFIFTILAEKSEPEGMEDFESDPGIDATVSDYSGKNILLVEDVAINREIVLALLEETCVNVECAENGVIACEMFAAEPEKFQLILMDLQMPEMDGLEATRNIRGMPGGKSIPIVAMTANVFKEDVEKCIAAGMNGHIAKPIEFDMLMQQLNEYLI